MYRSRLHILLGALLWAVFGYYWFIVVQRPITPHTQIALISVGSLVLTVTLVMFGWVIYNVRLASRNRRVTRSDAPAGPPADFLGRTFAAANQEEIRTARYIEVHLVESPREDSGGHKVFRVSEEIPGS